MAAKKIYNINEMRVALQRAYADGNAKCVNQKLCDELGISEGYFKTYLNNIENLYIALNAYIKIKHTPNATAEDIKKAYEKIFPLWKNALECGEKTKNAKDFHVELMDVEDLIGFCQKFAYISNSESATKAWASDTFSSFRRKVETMLGIKIAGIDVLSDEKRNWLHKERSLISKVARIEKEIKALEDNNDYLKARAKKVNSKAIKAFIKEDIDANNTKINDLKQKLTTAKNDLETFQSTSVEKSAKINA